MNTRTHTQPTRRQWLAMALPLLGASALAWHGLAQGKPQPIPLEVWKDPNCGCCQFRVDHLQANGLSVKVHDTGNNVVRAQLGLPAKLGSCHTGLVGGYVVEGHVPATDIHKLLALKPKALGLAVPGMPIGSPGMDGELYGFRQDAYDVLLVQRSGKTSVFQHYLAKPGKSNSA